MGKPQARKRHHHGNTYEKNLNRLRHKTKDLDEVIKKVQNPHVYLQFIKYCF